MSNKIFQCRSREGYSLKILAELLQNCLRTACFEIDNTGIKLRMMDHHRAVLIDLKLDSHNFSIYKFKSNEKLFLGINLTHFHKMLKSIKKRDSIELFIEENCPTDLVIKVSPKDSNRVTTSTIKIQNIQNLDIDLPEGYVTPVIVPSGEFQKMCKGLTHISNQTRVTAKGFLIRFSTDAGGVMKRYTEFGETEDEEQDDEEKSKNVEYIDEFGTDQLTKITKLAGLSANIQIYAKTDNPLMFRSHIGSLGTISIYVKSKSLQEVESHTLDEEDDE